MPEIKGKNSTSAPYNVAIVTSRFNEEVTQLLHAGAVEQLQQHGLSEAQITSVWVPGAVEISVAANALAKTDRFAAIIALGAVIRGETSHYDYVCMHVTQGCLQVALEHDIPVIFGMLTTENEQQALDRCGGKEGHKGREAADAALEMISVLCQIDEVGK